LEKLFESVLAGLSVIEVFLVDGHRRRREVERVRIIKEEMVGFKRDIANLVPLDRLTNPMDRDHYIKATDLMKSILNETLDFLTAWRDSNCLG
jgi:hypothetical protein